MISSINHQLPLLDQLRWVLKSEEEIRRANDAMSSLSNSFSRLSIFLAQKVEEWEAKKREGKEVEEVKQEEKLLDEDVQNTVKEDIKNIGGFLS